MYPLRIAIVGCGYIARKHIHALLQLEGAATVSALCDIDKNRMARFAAENCETQFPGVRMVESVEALLDDPNVELIAITTSSDSHSDLAVRALKAGKHVLVEKPLALSIEEGRAARDLAAETNRILAVSFQARYAPAIQAMKRAAELGRFGALSHGAVSMRWNRNESYYRESPWREDWSKGGGLFMNQCIHYIDLLRWLMGPVRSVYAQGESIGQSIRIENTGAVQLGFQSGAIGIIEASTCIYPRTLDTSISLFGQRGSAVVGGPQLSERRVWQFESEQDAESSSRTESVQLSHVPLYEDILACIRTGGKPLTAVDLTLDTHEIVLAVYQSMLSGKAVELPLEKFEMNKMNRRHSE
ncbi:Gfo/Idh/MocA family oxidoreductase [Paenibacillus sp. HB172176]|uniref:Gfo/Idh/MocA family protein n=1 Tax=Paenibacillus sp. HB172176 TaxID=2493690 RepID=UPI001439763E|nr:Gfo/Idh/MocA family oxidoreductase [Paenibacillus sp. HB172176]